MSATLSNGVPVEGLCDFVMTSDTLISGIGKAKWAQIHMKILMGLVEPLGAQACSIVRNFQSSGS